MEKQNINDLISRAKANNQTKTIQKVIPVKENKREEIQFSFYIDKVLLKKLKQRALNNDESIKNTITTAIENYLKTN